MPAYSLVFGLSADPLHNGHLAVVAGACRALLAQGYDLIQVLLVPVYRRNPVGDRKGNLPATYPHRLAMCTLGAEILQAGLASDGVQVAASPIEETLAKNTSQPNYAVTTLEALHRGPTAETKSIFLISCDLISGEEPELCRWHRPLHLIRLATLAVAPRPGFSPNPAFIAALRVCGADVIYLEEVQTPAISSRHLRARLAAGEEPAALARAGLLPTAVAEYIDDRGLYRHPTV